MLNVKDQKVKGQGHKVTHKKFTQSRALVRVTLKSKRLLIVVVAQEKLIMNRQIGVGNSKNVIVLDPLLTVHVILACAMAAYAFSIVTRGKRYNS